MEAMSLGGCSSGSCSPPANPQQTVAVVPVCCQILRWCDVLVVVVVVVATHVAIAVSVAIAIVATTNAELGIVVGTRVAIAISTDAVVGGVGVRVAGRLVGGSRVGDHSVGGWVVGDVVAAATVGRALFLLFADFQGHSLLLGRLLGDVVIVLQITLTFFFDAGLLFLQLLALVQGLGDRHRHLRDGQFSKGRILGVIALAVPHDPSSADSDVILLATDALVTLQPRVLAEWNFRLGIQGTLLRGSSQGAGHNFGGSASLRSAVNHLRESRSQGTVHNL
mmetsp:Transcript_24137/g.36544  ORF Transcript_24137/g.36544 Transcript_24137/m.36544 type:complete len:279 (+) Transcript_24137:288-1124(+)